jgi:hypoxanthine phosphoribosyltransferase
MKVLFSNEEIEERLKEVGEEITKDYNNEEMKVVVVLKGAFMTAATLVKYIDNMNLEMEFTRVSSYLDKKESTGKVNVLLDIKEDLTGENILIVEDIIDSGNTLNFLKEEYLRRGAKSVKIMTLLDKPSRRKVDITPDYTGFVIEDKFVVGYGLDNNEKERNIPYVGYID